MVQAEVRWLDGERFTADSRGHTLMVDSDRLRNTAPGPMDLVLVGLCACTATDIVSILTKKRVAFTGLKVRAEAERASEPPKVYTKIKVIYTVSGKVPKKAMEDAVRLSESKYCSVSQMVQKTAQITSVIEYADGNP